MHTDHRSQRRHGPLDWPTRPFTAWQASDHIADLLEEARVERLARTMTGRSTVVTTAGRLRTACVRLSTAIGGSARRRRQQSRIEPVSAGR